MMMCFIGSLRPEQKVGAGPYVALVDKSKCEDKGGGGESTSAGANAAVEYVNAVVESTRASDTAPMIVKAWITMKESGATLTIYVHTTVTAGASSTSPNGIFTMEFSGYLPNSSTPKMRGTLTSVGSTVTFYEEGDFGTPYTTKLTLSQSGTSSGTARIYDTEQGISDTTLAYNSTHFKRDTGTGDQCFSRDEDDGTTSVWQYGVYNSDGSRLALNSPGFSVNYTAPSGRPDAGTTYWGYSGFYGVWFPDDASLISGDTLTNPRTGATYTYTSVGGRLMKMTTGTTTFADIKGQSLRFYDPAINSEVKAEWNGTDLVRTEVILCSNNGCVNSAPQAGTETIDASALGQFGVLNLNGWSDVLGGQFMIPVPTSGEFSDATQVFYRTRTSVTTTESASLSLICISECLGDTLQMNSAIGQTGDADPYLTVGSNTRNWGPVPVNAAITYTFDANGMMVYQGGDVDASGLTVSGSNRWGLRSPTLVPDSAGIKCDSNGGNSATTHYCPQLIQSANVTYEWETGPNNWNKAAYLAPSGGSVISFDPPKRLVATLSTSNSTLPSGDSKLGSKVFLDYNGFGDLWGIPGSCYDKRTNEKIPCGSLSGLDQQYQAYAPDYSLQKGATVTDAAGTTSFFVKPIDKEIRFGRVVSGCSSLELPANATLPTASTAPDPKVTIGATAPTPSSNVPAVIHGVVQ